LIVWDVMEVLGNYIVGYVQWYIYVFYTVRKRERERYSLRVILIMYEIISLRYCIFDSMGCHESPGKL
jgi:hypothetical protein